MVSGLDGGMGKRAKMDINMIPTVIHRPTPSAGDAPVVTAAIEIQAINVSEWLGNLNVQELKDSIMKITLQLTSKCFRHHTDL